MDDRSVELLDELATSDPELYDIWLGLLRHAESFADIGDETLTDEQLAKLPAEALELRRLASAFAFHLADRDSREDSREPYQWGRYRCWTPHPWPSQLSAVDDATLEVWEEASRLAGAPAARARLHDLLFLRRHGDVREHLEAAIEAYLETAQNCTSDLTQANTLERALEIAASTRQQESLDLIIHELITSAETALRDKDSAGKPGVVLGFLRPLVREHVAADRLGPLLADARDGYAEDPWITESIVELQLALASDEERPTLDRQLIQSWLDFADRVPPGLAQMMWLQSAARLATDRGHPDLREEAVQRLEAITMEDLDLKVVETSAPVPRDEIERFIDQALEEPTAVDAIRRFISGPPPSGTLERNAAQARRHREEFVFTQIFTPVRVAYDGMPQFEPNTDEQRDQPALAEIENYALQHMGPLYARAIQRIGEHFDPEFEQLRQRLGDLPAVTAGTSRSLARALRHFWHEEYEAALLVALPRIETLARQLLRMAGVPLYRTQVGDTPGTYPGLGNLLGRLEEPLLDPDWRRYLETLLVLPGVGLNVRNDRLHGLDESDVHPTTAALVLVGCLHLAFVEPGPESPGNSTDLRGTDAP